MQECFIIKESTPDPQTIGAQTIPAATSTDSEGNVNILSWRREIAVLRSKVRVIEGRGYTRDDALKINSAGESTVLYNGNFSFESRVVSFDINRINEADMFRITKTITIKALYVNGVYVAGETSFSADDNSI